MSSRARLTGIPASPGMGVGPAWWHRRRPAVAPRAPGAPADERARLDAARREAADEIRTLLSRAADRIGSEEAGIFHAHLLMLDDPDLLEQVARGIEAGAPAEAAWDTAVQSYAAKIAALPGEVFQARAADVRDVGDRVLRRLAGVETTWKLPDHPVVVMAEELTPSDTVDLTEGRVAAICTAGGGPTSHAAILARRLGVPAVVGLGDALHQVGQDTLLLVDGETGEVVLEPTAAEQHAARQREAERRSRRAALMADAAMPAVTRDGVRIEVAANVGGTADAEAAIRAGADGIGLLRTEFLYLDRAQEPDEDEQVGMYRTILRLMGPRPVVVRTLDAGGDKPIPYLPLPPEPNPFLGVRGIRLAARYPELLSRQLRAILRAGAGHAVRIMFPMVTTVDEMRALRELAERERAALSRRGVPVPDNLQIGMMVEVPSAALLAGRFLPWTDFFSIGTNDLTQYTLAADRTNAAVAGLADGLHPAVLRLIQTVTAAAAPAGKWVGVCGELAADDVATPLLLGLGVTELSMTPAAVPGVKAAVRKWSLGGARRLAAEALEAPSAEAVRDMARGAEAS
ncbi:MAG: phosphoenolpyruvate--protein phosphotransferase [Armatimonadota bacterium]|nr:phosphoenolpyruvate--protein phosphotransferase [Armatimonadota bacterium]